MTSDDLEERWKIVRDRLRQALAEITGHPLPSASDTPDSIGIQVDARVASQAPAPISGDNGYRAPHARMKASLRPDIEPGKSMSGLAEEASEPPFAGYLPATAKMSILAGISLEWSEMIVSETPIDRVTRPWFLGEAKDVFGLVVATDNMAPVILAADWVVVNERLPVRREREAIFCSAKENLTFKAIIARYIGQTPTHWAIEEYSPGQGGDAQRSIPKAKWPSAYPIVARINKG